jgi:FPC/CPF motif-containing protein YcgG
MRDAQHCRAQAELCLQIAGLLSDPEAAAGLRSRAAEYLTHAVEPNSPCSIEEQRDRRVPFRR